RNLRLVGRVGGEELAPGDERVNHDGAVMMVGAGAEKTGVVACGSVLGSALAEPVENVGFRHGGRNAQVAPQAILGRNGLEEIVRRAHADFLEHLPAVFGGFGKITHKPAISFQPSAFRQGAVALNAGRSMLSAS